MMRSGQLTTKHLMMRFNKRKIHTLIEYQFNKGTGNYDEVRDEFYLYEGDVALAGGTPVRETGSWGFYDDGTESGAVIIGSVNTNPALGVDTIYHYRQVMEETAGNTWADADIQLQYNHNSGGWNDVNGASSVVRSAPTSGLSDGSDTTARIAGTGTFETYAGQDDVDGYTTDGSRIQSEYINAVYAFSIITADVADTDTILLRLWDTVESDTFDTNQQADALITVNDPVIPQNYERTLTSEIDAQDAQQAYENKLRKILSSINTTDTISSIVSVGPILRTLSSSIDLSDGDLQRLQEFNYLVANNATINDNVVIQELLSRILLSSLDINDELVRTITAAGAALERLLVSSLDINDNLINELQANRLLTDNVDLYDLIVREILVSGTLVSRILSSSIDVNDSLSRDALLFRLLISTANTSDSLDVGKLILRLLNDNADLSDSIISLIQGLIVSRTLSSNLGISDGDLQRIQDINYTTANSIDAIDNILRVVTGGATVISRVLSSDINILDALLLASKLERILTSYAEISEGTFQYSKLNNLTLNDNVDIQDFIISTVEASTTILSRVLSSGVDLSDYELVRKELERQLSNYLDINDLINIEFTDGTSTVLSRVLSSGVDLNDFELVFKELQRQLINSLNINDLIISTFIDGSSVILSRLLVSGIDLSDDERIVKELNRHIFSSLIASDQLLQDKRLVRLLSSDLELLDAVIRTIQLAPQDYLRTLTDNTDIQDAIIREFSTLLRGYILMNIESSSIITDTKTSNIVIDTKE